MTKIIITPDECKEEMPGDRLILKINIQFKMNLKLSLLKTGTKEIWITNESVLSDIQHEFNLGYPFLKIEFLKTDSEARNLRSVMIDPSTALKQLANLRIARKIDINNYRTVAEISHDFEIALGIIAQVSRKSGNIWNLISVTDGWTLETQNAAGEFISSEMKEARGI